MGDQSNSLTGRETCTFVQVKPALTHAKTIRRFYEKDSNRIL